MEQIRGIERWTFLLIATTALTWHGGQSAGAEMAANPAEPGPCEVSAQIVEIDEISETRLFFPSDSECGGVTAAPYPGLVFAHGFSMFGLTNGAADNAGHGGHMASWGYVVAIPVLSDDVEGRIEDVQAVLSYLETETATPGSTLYQKVDVGRLAAAGHSFGGATVLALAARDARVKAVVALDPVYHQGGPFGGEEPVIWDPAIEGVQVTVPTSIQGAPASNCNSEGDYAEITPFVGASHKAEIFIVDASHCDFMDPGQSMCEMVCDGSVDPARTRLVRKYMTAWFNYYLYLETDQHAYIYGDEADADVAAGRIEREVSTAPRNLTATGLEEAITLDWDLYDHAIVAGYNIYRSTESGSYSADPYARVGRVSSYVDSDVVGGQRTFYTLRSRDLRGNEHQASDEVSAVPEGSLPPSPEPTPSGELEHLLYLPLILARGEIDGK